MKRAALIARLRYYACEDAEQGDVLADAIALLQRDGWKIAALEADRDAAELMSLALRADRDRLAARNAEYELLLKDTYALCNPDWPWMHGLKKRIRAALAGEGENNDGNA